LEIIEEDKRTTNFDTFARKLLDARPFGTAPLPSSVQLARNLSASLRKIPICRRACSLNCAGSERIVV
jgi:hypothetical protein